MFLQWSFLPVNVILAMFQFLLVSTVGSILSIYSRFGGEYANSIRWIRQGGYFEMYNTLVNSRELISNKTKLILVVTILSSLSASIADIGAVYFISPSVQESIPLSQLVETNQFSSLSTQNTFIGWEVTVRNGANITDAMVSVMNDTNRIPNAVSTRTYTPQFSEYQVGCGMMNFNVIYYGNDKFLINQGGCANVYYGFYNTFEGLYNKSTIVNMANDRRSYKIPIIYQKGMFLQETAAALYFTYANTTCGLYEVVDNTILLHTPTDGLTSSPTTWTSRCALPTGEIMISSFTRIKFFVTEVQRFKTVSSSMFSDDVELVNDMATSIMKAGNNTFQFVELKLGNTSIEAVECITLNLGNASLSAICSYNSVNNILSSPQELNPAISSARRGAPIAALPLNGLAGDTSSSNLFIAISHIPIKSNSSIQQISIPEAKNASSAAAHYIALLGQNIYMDWYTSKMYAIYNIVDIEEGLEIPLWLIIVVFISMLFCTVLCCSTQFLLEPLYTGSLYKVMSIQMAPRSSSFASIVRWSKDYPIEYEGFHTTTGNNGFYEVDLKPETTLTQLS